MKEIKRYIEKNIEQDLERKMVFVSGPRQSGKTTLAKSLIKKRKMNERERYLNWDAATDREMMLKEQFPLKPGLLVFDEIHKYTRWRQMLKGLYDVRNEELDILVTGSAKLDHYRHGGDSLQGRYYFYRLYPLSFAELKMKTSKDLGNLMVYGGFPEPFFSASERESKRWSKAYRSRLVREELQDLEQVKDINLVEMLVMRLPELVGAPLSVNALREDLQVSHKTVSRWIAILENLYMLFRIYPFGAPKIRAVKKEAKHYHYDWTLVKEPGLRFENLVACHLLKWCHFMEDTNGREMELRYFRDIDRREVDFVIMEDGHPVHFVECKKLYRSPNTGLKYLKQRFPEVQSTQVSLEGQGGLVRKDGIILQNAADFLSGLV